MEMHVEDRLAHPCASVGNQAIALVIVTGAVRSRQAKFSGDLAGNDEDLCGGLGAGFTQCRRIHVVLRWDQAEMMRSPGVQG